MNIAIEFLPSSCDVLIICAGSAGSAAAITLARAGRDVVIIDQLLSPEIKCAATD